MGIDPSMLTPSYVVDMFITDCALPSTKHKVQFTEVQKVFEAYCDNVGIGVPCSNKSLGKYLSQRFQKSMRQGYTFYFMEWKPGIFDIDN